VKDLKDKVAVVTGAASGIGKALAERFARAGMRLALVDIEEEPLAETADALAREGAQVWTRLVDVSNAEAVDSLAAGVVEHFGTAHVVCNNAGVGGGAGPMWELTLADWEFTLGPNLWGVIHGVRAFSKILMDQDEGHFVNTASMAGLVSAGRMGPYNVTKQGVVALSETLFADLAAAGSKVGVSVLCPGFVQSQIWNSDRVRPEHLKNDPKSEAQASGAAMQDMLRNVIENAMPASQVADRVHDAILENRLYILTHEATAPMLTERIRVMLSGENPATPANPGAGLSYLAR
jgi:NAD(P)-dependent dehydrogenase (short-subunit alcohol dehydrogenase family)